MKPVPMTVRGETQLREELDHLKNVRRPKIIEDIAVAREHQRWRGGQRMQPIRGVGSRRDGRPSEDRGHVVEQGLSRWMHR